MNKIEKLRKKFRDTEVFSPDTMDLKNFCFFIGFARSGHSFIGQLINAHENALIGNEGRLFDVLKGQLSFSNVLKYLVFIDEKFASRKYYKKNGQDFYFAKLSQGNVHNLTCLGNSKAGYTRRHFYANPSLLDAYRSIIPGEVKFILVLRNPRDIVGSMMKRTGRDFQTALEEIQRSCEELEVVINLIKPDFQVLEIVYENLLQDLPSSTLKIFSFLGLDLPPGFTEAVQEKIYQSPEKSRRFFDNIPNAEEHFQELTSKHAFFASYRN